MKPSGASRRAFTLVELLAVMAIVSILAALLLPAIARSRREARVIQCKSNLRQIGMSVSMYSQYFDGWMPTDGFSDDPDAGKVATSVIWNSIPMPRPAGYTGLGLLCILDQRFLGDAAVLFCPGDSDNHMGESVRNMRFRPANDIAECSYIYRQLDARDADSGRAGKLGGLGLNPAGQPVKAIAADRNYLSYRDDFFTDPARRIAHDGTTVNILREDGSVVSALNNFLDSPNDLRLNMMSTTPPTGTDGKVYSEMDRVWTLYDTK
jgi:prepilin-type N-terminal cleavage/methylation domain-containing protein